MKVYLKSGRRDHLMFITPGSESDGSDFFNDDGSVRQFTVRFKDGMASVPSNIGQYLLDKGVAQRSPLIEPKIAQQIIGMETRVRNHRILASAVMGSIA